MPVIINDLEVILETPETTAPDEAASTPVQPSEAAASLTPQTLERIEAHRRSRVMRVRAH